MVWEMLRNLEMCFTHSMPFFPAALLPFIHPPLPISLGTGIDGSCTQNCVLLHLVSKWIWKAPAKQQKFRKQSCGLQMQHPKRGFKTIQNCPSFNEPLTALSTAAAVVSLHATSAQKREHPSLYRKRNYPIPIAWGPCAPVQLLIAANFQPFRKHLPGAMRSKRREVSFAKHSQVQPSHQRVEGNWTRTFCQLQQSHSLLPLLRTCTSTQDWAHHVQILGKRKVATVFVATKDDKMLQKLEK